MQINKDGVYVEDPVHEWFGLTYASYAVLPRIILQSMSLDWQEKFVALMNEVDEIPEFSCPKKGTYAVLVRDRNGKFIQDSLPRYRHNHISYKKEKL